MLDVWYLFHLFIKHYLNTECSTLSRHEPSIIKIYKTLFPIGKYLNTVTTAFTSFQVSNEYVVIFRIAQFDGSFMSLAAIQRRFLKPRNRISIDRLDWIPLTVSLLSFEILIRLVVWFSSQIPVKNDIKTQTES